MEPKSHARETADTASTEADDDTPTVGDLIDAEAQLVVRSHVIAGMAVGLVPVPVVDVLGVLGISVRMVNGLCQCYGINFSEGLARTTLIALLPSILPAAISGAGASLLKSLPVVGWVAGATSVSLLSGTVIYALGQLFIRHFEQGGTLEDIDLVFARKQLKSNLSKARQAVQEMRNPTKTAAYAPADPRETKAEKNT